MRRVWRVHRAMVCLGKGRENAGCRRDGTDLFFGCDSGRAPQRLPLRLLRRLLGHHHDRVHHRRSDSQRNDDDAHDDARERE
jgi:hypothetical protein